MGLDAIIRLTGDLTEAPTRFAFSAEYDDPHGDAPSIQVYGAFSDNGRFDFNLDRFWSLAYPRGDWPMIYALIRACKATWPNADVWYSSDHDDPGEEQKCTDEFLATQWNDWIKVEGGLR